jgi:hypothetical protein
MSFSFIFILKKDILTVSHLTLLPVISDSRRSALVISSQLTFDQVGRRYFFDSREFKNT